MPVAKFQFPLCRIQEPGFRVAHSGGHYGGLIIRPPESEQNDALLPRYAFTCQFARSLLLALEARTSRIAVGVSDPRVEKVKRIERFIMFGE